MMVGRRGGTGGRNVPPATGSGAVPWPSPQSRDRDRFPYKGTPCRCGSGTEGKKRRCRRSTSAARPTLAAPRTPEDLAAVVRTRSPERAGDASSVSRVRASASTRYVPRASTARISARATDSHMWPWDAFQASPNAGEHGAHSRLATLTRKRSLVRSGGPTRQARRRRLAARQVSRSARPSIQRLQIVIRRRPSGCGRSGRRGRSPAGRWVRRGPSSR